MNVYFIRCCIVGTGQEVGPIKIGVSNNPKKRMNDLQTSNPFRLEIVESVEFQNERQAFALEKKIHHKFRKKRLRGEWFCSSVLDDALAMCKKAADKNRRWEKEIVPESLDSEHLASIRGLYL